MKTFRIVLALTVLTLASVACDSLKDPDPWEVSITYEGREGPPTVQPDVINARGRFGFVVVTNSTSIERGFAITELAVFEKILPDEIKKISVEEAKDGKTYPFFDFLNPGQIEGSLVVKYTTDDER